MERSSLSEIVLDLCRKCVLEMISRIDGEEGVYSQRSIAKTKLSRNTIINFLALNDRSCVRTSINYQRLALAHASGVGSVLSKHLKSDIQLSSLEDFRGIEILVVRDIFIVVVLNAIIECGSSVIVQSDYIIQADFALNVDGSSSYWS